MEIKLKTLWSVTSIYVYNIGLIEGRNKLKTWKLNG